MILVRLRVRPTINIANTHTAFPAYVNLSLMPPEFWATVTNGGGDIRCYADQALTQPLAREVVSCATATDTGELWVSMTMKNNAVIFITADGTSTEPAANSTYGSQAVWGSDAKYVGHMQSNADDSSANGANGTYSNAPNFVAGKLGNAAENPNGSGVVRNITLPSQALLATTDNIILQCWFHPYASPNERFMGRFYGSNANARSGSFALNTSSQGDRFYVENASVSTFATMQDQYLTLNTWRKLTGYWDQSSGNVRFYSNGALATLGTDNFAGPSRGGTSSAQLFTKFTGDNLIYGMLDEVRCFKGSIPANFADREAFEYACENDNATFWLARAVLPQLHRRRLIMSTH